MIVCIEKSVFENAVTEEARMQLSFLLYLVVYKTCYVLSIKDDVTETDYYKSLPQSLQEVLGSAFLASVTASTEADCLVGLGYESETKERKFSLQESISYLLEPSSVVLENGLNDAFFITAVLRCYDDSMQMVDFLEKGWLQFDNAGGCGNIKNFLQARVNHYKNKTKFLKCFVVVDGDCQYTGQEQTKYNNLKKYLEKWGIGYHILEKRTMENYMPMAVLDAQRGAMKREWTQAYSALTPQQRDHLSISGGFSQDIPKVKKENLKNDIKKFKKQKKHLNDNFFVRNYIKGKRQQLYADVSNGSFVHLALGYPIEGVFKEEFPKLYKEPSITRNDFDVLTQHQTNRHELAGLAEAIASII